MRVFACADPNFYGQRRARTRAPLINPRKVREGRRRAPEARDYPITIGRRHGLTIIELVNFSDSGEGGAQFTGGGCALKAPAPRSPIETSVGNKSALLISRRLIKSARKNLRGDRVRESLGPPRVRAGISAGRAR